MKHLALPCIVLLILVICLPAAAQVIPADTLNRPQEVKTAPVAVPPLPKKWYEKITMRGYLQVRYNRLLETNPNLRCDQCDRSWGTGEGLFIRRARMVLSGNLSERIYFYMQPDFASAISSTQLNYVQLRDAYMDLALDPDQEFRLRLGLSKVPFGFENVQSSQNRLPLDRSDALNSAFFNERDMAALFYWAPRHIRDRFSTIVTSGLKGSGDYGVFGFGVFNGQTANRSDANKELHVVGRLTYPFLLSSGQYLEPGVYAYTGKYALLPFQLSPGVTAGKNYTDQRVAASVVVYPQPFGFQAEYNVGRGPKYNPQTQRVEVKPVQGGYVLLSYRQLWRKQTFLPFGRLQYFKGGKKHELDARSYLVKELELGLEWQPVPSFELNATYTFSDRTFEDFSLPQNRQKGRLLRLQAQINY